jgi:ubiquinol-cytochrome c reductase cytochrome c subunit
VSRIGWSRLVLLVPAVAAVATFVTVSARQPAAASTAAPSGDVGRGRQLYEVGCVSCHGASGDGVRTTDGERGPSLKHAGEAAAYYYLSTGRMPLANSEERPRRKPAAYPARDIDALVAYVASLGDGPPLPRTDPAAGDLAKGGELYRANCQACHSASGSGGALSYGRAAPGLHSAAPPQIAAAVRSGPGQMPVFGEDVLDDPALASTIRYVRYLRDPADPGGLPIGRTGPIPEGFVAWIIGIGALLALTTWIGTRAPIRSERQP